MVVFLARTVFVALIATLGDFYWFEYGVQHTTLHGVLHGAALLCAVGLVLGQHTGAWIRGALGGIGAGVGGALAFYAVVGGLGYLGGLIAAWVFMWMALAAVVAWLRDELRAVQRWLVPGLIAAASSGAMFYLVSAIWTDHAPDDGRNYFWHLIAWTIAWAPGITALTWKGDQR